MIQKGGIQFLLLLVQTVILLSNEVFLAGKFAIRSTTVTGNQYKALQDNRLRGQGLSLSLSLIRSTFNTLSA